MSRIKEFFAKNKKLLLSYACLFFVMLVLFRAKVVNVISPFGQSFVFSLVLLGKNGIVVGVLCFIARMVQDFSVSGLLISGCLASFVMLLYLIHKILKKKVNIVSTLIFALLSQSATIYFSLSSSEMIAGAIIESIVVLCFIYVFYICFGAVFYRGLQSPFKTDETVCFSVFLICFFCGLSGIYLFDVNLSSPFVILLLLVCSRCISKTKTIYFSAFAGVGFAFYSGNLTFLAVFVCMALICVSLCKEKRIYTVLSVAFCDAIFGVFFGSYLNFNFVNIIPMLVVLLAFLCLPEKLFKKIQGYSYCYEGSLISEFLISGERSDLKNHLCDIGGLFKQMQSEYRNLSIGEADKDSASEIMSGEVYSKICEFCPRKQLCSENQKIKQAIVSLFRFGIEKGKVTILDANNLLTENCNSLSSMIAEVNSSLQLYFEYEKNIKSSDQGKLFASEQMGATSEIFSEIASSSLQKFVIDEKKSKEVLDELLSNRVISNECAVLKNEEGVRKVVLVVRNSDVVSPKIRESLKNVFHFDFSSRERKMSKYSGWSILVFVPAEKYRLTIGFASKSKEEKISGDTKTAIRIGENKYLFAISDGMGHGEKANKIATSALSLIENFYRVGFSTDKILTSVNRLLLPSGEDNFVTLDAVLIDTSLGVCDFVKIGSSVSVIKSENQSETISCSSLPLGITMLSKPEIISRILKEKDIIVLASDGIVDSFDKVEDYVNFVNNESVINLQMFADNILEEAESRAVHKDDMTVMTIKLNPCL